MTALIRLLSSTPFRLTLAYMGAFVAAAALIVGFIAWRANDLLTNKVVETLEAEITQCPFRMSPSPPVVRRGGVVVPVVGSFWYSV